MPKRPDPFIISPYLVRLALEKNMIGQKVSAKGYDENTEKGNLVFLYGILAMIGGAIVWVLTRRLP